jgi:hypothetical protein
MDFSRTVEAVRIMESLLKQGLAAMAMAPVGQGYLVITDYSSPTLALLSSFIKIEGYDFGFVGVGKYEGTFILTKVDVELPLNPKANLN